MESRANGPVSRSEALKPLKVMSVGTSSMNRAENLAALELVIAAMTGVSPESQSMNNLRRAAYIHAIVEDVLNEQVSCLPQTCQSIR